MSSVRVLGIIQSWTMNLRRPQAAAEAWRAEFYGRPVLAHVATALHAVNGLDRIIALLPPDGDREQHLAACRAAGVEWFDYGNLPYDNNLFLRVAEQLGAEHVMFCSAHALLLDAELAAKALQRHLAAPAAATKYPDIPVGLAPGVISMAALREGLAKHNLTFASAPPLGDLFRRDPAAFSTNVMSLELPPDLPAGLAEHNLHFIHPAQQAAFAGLWAAAGGRGAVSAIRHIAAHPAAFDYFPRWAQVELTSRCNQNCPVCPHGQRAAQADMPVDIFDRLVDDLGWNSAQAGIDLAGFGEPLLHPQFRRCLERAVRAELEVYLYTNGTVWSPDLAEYLLAPERQGVLGGLKGIIFTVNATTPDAYRAFHGTDDLAAVVRNIRALLQLKKQRQCRTPVVALQIVKSQLTDAQVEAFWQEWNYAERFEKERWPDYDFAGENGRLRQQTMALEHELLDAAEQQRRLAPLQAEFGRKYQEAFYRHAELPLEHVVIQRCNDYAGQLPDRRVVDYTPLERFPCRQVGDGPLVLSDGSVTPCQQDFNATMAMGQLRDAGLVTIWNRPRYAALRGDQREGRFTTTPLCAACRDWFIPLR